MTVWFCTFCQSTVQIGARPVWCPDCGDGHSLKPLQVPYVPEQTRPLHAEPFG